MKNALPSAYASFPSAFALAGAAVLAFAGLVATTSPAQAQAASTDYRCTALVEQARTAATGAQGAKQTSANRFVATGLKLCEAGNERAAAKQFRAALKVVGVAEVAPNGAMAAR